MAAVQRDTVIRMLVLALKNTDISISVNENVVTIVKEGIPEVTFLPDMVPIKMLHRFDAKYGVRIEYFFHPEMCHAAPASTQ